MSGQMRFERTFEELQRDQMQRLERLERRPSLNARTSRYLRPTELAVPEAPTGVTLLGNLPIPGEDGSPYSSRLRLQWDPVTVDTEGVPIEVNQYEIWIERDALEPYRETAVRTNEGLAYLPGGTTANVYVRAGTIRGLWSDFSAPLLVEGALDLLPMDPPTAPVLSSKLGTVKVEWDGELSTGLPPTKFRYVYAEVSDTEMGVYSPLGPTFSTSGTVLPGLEVGDTVWVRLVAVDTLGIASDPGPSASIVVQGVEGPDIELGAITIDNVDAALEEAITGALDPDRIGQATISTDKLLVANLTNLLEDPSFERGELIWSNEETTVTKSSTAPRTGGFALAVEATTVVYDASIAANPIRVDEGEEYLVAGWVRAATTGEEGGITLSVAYGDDETTADGVDDIATSPESLGTTYLQFSGGWAVPTGARWARLVVRSADTLDTSIYYLDDVALIRRADTTLLVDGSIVASKLAADSVTADAIAANSISAEALQAESVIAGKLAVESVLADNLAAESVTANAIQAGAIEVIHLSAPVNEILTVTAGQVDIIVTESLPALQGEVDANGNTIAELSTYYSFTEDGAIISTPDSLYSLRLQNDGIQIIEGIGAEAVEVSRWDSGRLIVDQFVGKSVVLGNHQLEEYTDGTVIRLL